MTFAGTTDYETWVLGLEAWTNDPNFELSGLPQLDADSLPPSAYQRLIAHIQNAQQEVMNSWQRRLTRNFESARTDHEYARALVELRCLLGRQLQLARHPGLPEEIRKPLTEGMERNIRRLQEDLENAVMQPGRGSGTQLTGRERTLRLVRANSFTAILKPGFPLESLFAPSATASGSPAHDERFIAPGAFSDGPKRVTRRRVVIDGG